MADKSGCEILTDAAWAVWEPLIEQVRPRGKTPPKELRRTISAIFWRHQNGAKWRSIPTELGPWLLGCLPDVPGWIVGDRGFASDAFRERIWNLGARPAIPPKRTDRARRLPGVDLRQPSPRREPLGPA